MKTKSQPSQGSESPGRKQAAFWILMAIGLVACVGMFWASQSRGAESNYVSKYVPSTREAVAPAPAAVFLGDSYTEGVHATEDAARYTTRVCNEFRWRCEVSGQGGTGYTNSGQSSQNESIYADRVAKLQETDPAIVVVQGSVSDPGNKEDVKLAAGIVFADLRARYPSAEIVAVGPVAAPGLERDRIIANRDGIAEASAENKVRFIDPIAANWFTDVSLFSTDKVHPSDAGYQVYADRLMQELR